MGLTINGLADQPKHFAELNKLLVVSSGHDVVKYVDLLGGRAGDLGFQDWSNYWQKATGVATVGADELITETATTPSEDILVTEAGDSLVTEASVTATGSLETGKFYSIVVVPMNTRRSSNLGFIQGQPTSPAIPIEITDAGDDSHITWTIPVHPQLGIYDVGSHDGLANAAVLTDSTEAWETNELVGKTLKNLTDGSSTTVTANTATTVTGVLAGGTDNDWDIDDEYQVLDSEAVTRRIYASRGDTAGDAWAGPFTLAATIEDNTTTTWQQLTYAVTTTTADFDRLPPPAARFCHSAFNRIWYTGSVRELRGKVEYQSTPETKSSQSVTLTVTTTDFGGASAPISGQIIRYTLDSGTWTSAIRRGSIATVTAGAGTLSTVNELTTHTILRVEDVASPTWFEVLLPNGVAEAAVTADFSIKPNYLIGNLSGDDQTYFREGMAGFQVGINASTANKVLIDSVDEATQEVNLQTNYLDTTTGQQEFTVDSAIELFWSATGDAGVVPISNVIEVPGRPFAIGHLDRHILTFTERSILKLPENNISQGFYTVADDRGTTAPFSLVREPRGYSFFDGEGISRTDGVSAGSISRFKADDYLRSVNQEAVYNIRGIYDPQDDQLIYVFPLGTNQINNFGLVINAGSTDFYPIKLLDANALWRERSADGQWNVFHGSTNRNTQTGKSYIWEHDHDFESDGTTPDEGWIGNVTSVVPASDYFVIADIASNPIVPGASLTEEPYQYEGVPAVVVNATASTEAHFIVKKIDDNGDNTHNVYWGGDFDLDTLDPLEGLAFFLGVIPVHFGPKFTDFGSPRFLHSVREVSIDFEQPDGPSWVFIDYYRDGKLGVIKTTAHYISTEVTKLVSPARVGKTYQFGYRIRVYSPNRIKIHNITTTFTTHT
jgi:hypothetical protein